MQMYQLIEWFQVNYSELHNDLLNCYHNYDEKNLNPYHLESDCWSHTMMVCKIAEISQYDKVVRVAALLHDIGKPMSRKVNPKNNHIQFFGHEELSGILSETILSLMVEKSIINQDEKYVIKDLIVLHGLLHKVNDPIVLKKLFCNRKLFYIHLVQLSRCDELGRFCADNNVSDDKYDKLISYADGYK